MKKVLTLVHAWLVLDFFGDSRRAGTGNSSSLTSTIFTQSFLGLLFAALLYPETPPVAFAAANLCLSTVLVTIGALGDESRPWRVAANEHLLRTSPLSSLTVTIARSTHAAFATSLVTVGMALPPAILLANLQEDVWQAPAYVVAACVSSGLACGALGAAGRLLTQWTGAARTALWLGTAKAVLLGGGVVLFALCLPRLQGTADALPFGSVLAWLTPPWHLARWLAAPSTEAWRLGLLAGVGAVLLLVAALASRPAARHATRVGRDGLLRRLLRRLTERGPHRAIAEFVAIGIWRNAAFRARVLPLLGIPAATALLSARAEAENAYALTSALLQLPAIYLPFLVAFLPRSDQPGTEWLFAQAPQQPIAAMHDAVWRALVTHVLLPVFAFATVLVTVTGSTGLGALPAAAFAFGIAVVAARPAARALAVIPFTAARDVESGPDLGSLFLSALLLGGFGLAFGLWLPETLRWPGALLACALAGWLLARPAPRAGVLIQERDATGMPADGDASTQVHGGPADREKQRKQAPASLRGELRAIAWLLLILCGLPLALGGLLAS